MASLRSFNISKQQTNVGLINFGNEASEALRISHDPAVVENKLKNLQRIGGQRTASKAVELARTMLSASDANDRKGKVLVLFLLGKIEKSDERRFIDEVNEIQKQGVGLVFVTVKVVDGRLIAGNLKNKDNLIEVGNIEDIDSVFGNVENQIAKVTGNISNHIISNLL